MAADNGFTSKLIRSFRDGNIITRLIFINVGVFVVLSLAEVFLTLFNISVGTWKMYLMFPASAETFIRQPWTLVTYMFVHAGVLHVLFNMLWLYWFGTLSLNFFSSKHLRGLYLLGGIMGAVVYMAAYHVFPYFHGHIDTAYVVGASASVLAIVVAAAVREPEYSVQFMFIGSVRLKYVALFMVVLDLLFMTSDNAGGHIAHLGGALAGWWFAAGLAKGHDATQWINQLLDLFTASHKPRRKKSKMKVYYSPDKQKENDNNTRKRTDEDELNRILDKLRKSGYGSLTDDEKRSLFDASKK